MSADEPDQEAVQWGEARLWFARADDDLAVAKLSLRADPPVLGVSAFLCQQAAEKLLKGLLIASSRGAPKTHDLARLAPDVAAAFPELASLVLDIRPYGAWYLVGRYPDVDQAPPRQADVEAALDALHGLRTRLIKLDPDKRGS